MGVLTKIMRGGIPLGSLFGSKLYLNLSWFVMYGLVIFFGYMQGVVFIPMVLFPCLALIILMHEYGHVFMARLFGIRCPDITLSALGGAAVLDGMPEKGWQEVLVALAGPAVNVFLAAVLWLILSLSGGAGAEQLDMTAFSGTSFLILLMVANILIAGFNVVPAFPMDGGRVLRGTLSHLMDYRTATRAAAYVGLACAAGFVYLWITGSIGGFSLPLIAYFLVTNNLRLLKLNGEDRPEKLREMVLEQYAEVEERIQREITTLITCGDAVDPDRLGALYEQLHNLAEERKAFLDAYDQSDPGA